LVGETAAEEAAQVPAPRPATLNGVKGSGYAVITRPSFGLRSCRGVIAVDAKGAEAIIAADNRGDDLTFSGVVFDGTRERQATFQVVVSVDIDIDVEAGRDTSAVRFTAIGDPFGGD
jgi:hypothetical protein